MQKGVTHTHTHTHHHHAEGVHTLHHYAGGPGNRHIPWWLVPRSHSLHESHIGFTGLPCSI